MKLQDYLSGKTKASKGVTKEWLPFCTMDVKSGKLWVGDPQLANEDDGCVVKVPRGKYVVEAIGLKFGKDRVVSRVRVRLESAENPTLGEEVGDTGTDSAMIGVAEIDVFEKAYKKEGGADRVQEAMDELGDADYGVLQVPEFPGTFMPFLPTGSDGGGPVMALMSGGKCVGFEVKFMDEDDI